MSTATTTKLRPGDGTLTRRILKRCREAGFSVNEEGNPVRIGGGRWGWERTGYIVPTEIYEEELARRNTEKSNAERLEAERAERERLAWMKERTQRCVDKYPSLEPSVVESLVNQGHSLYSPSEVGYQHRRATKTYWNRLGYRVGGKPSGLLVYGSRLYPVYDAYSLREKRSRVTVDQLLRDWRCKFGSDESVLAEAIRFANRLQKVKRHVEFYTLKDQWIAANQDKLVDGRIARIETRLCYHCSGEGCWNCDDGVYSSRTLYEHVFAISGRTYVFHSYTRPRTVSTTPGADLAHYGRPFQADELPLPPQSVLVSLVKLLCKKDDKAREGECEPAV